MGVFFLNFLRALKGPTKNLVLRTTLFLVYLLFGAAVFQTIESGAEHKEIHHFDKVQQQMREKYNISDAEMNHLFEEISKAIDDGYFDVGYDRWSFAGSLFFSGTVVTTIGKKLSHVRPISENYARIYTMLFAQGLHLYNSWCYSVRVVYHIYFLILKKGYSFNSSFSWLKICLWRSINMRANLRTLIFNSLLQSLMHLGFRAYFVCALSSRTSPALILLL